MITGYACRDFRTNVSVIVKCDGCRTVTATWVAGRGVPKGWRCDGTRDLCPACARPGEKGAKP